MMLSANVTRIALGVQYQLPKHNLSSTRLWIQYVHVQKAMPDYLESSKGKSQKAQSSPSLQSSKFYGQQPFLETPVKVEILLRIYKIYYVAPFSS